MTGKHVAGEGESNEPEIAEPYPEIPVDPDIQAPTPEQYAPEQYVEPHQKHEPSGTGPAQYVG
jgi:hypothetical protein